MKKIVSMLFIGSMLCSGISLASTFIHFNSEEGDSIGQGKTQTWSAAHGEFSAQTPVDSSESVSIDFRGDEAGVWWWLNFSAPKGEDLAVGRYTNATRYPFQEPENNGLSVGGSGRGCNTLTGNFEVLEIEYTDSGELVSFAANFEQHCEDRDPALFGTVSYNASLDQPAGSTVSVDLQANAQDQPVTVALGDTVDLSWTVNDAGVTTDTEYWIGLSGTVGATRWFNSDQWKNSTQPLIWKTQAPKSIEKHFNWTPATPGIYMLQMMLDDQVSEPAQLDSIYAHDHVVVIVESQ